jgi:hypothetical protein
MANWKKVIVSGSIAELAKVTASSGVNIPTKSLQTGNNDNFVLTVGSQGSVEKRDPKTIGAAFQSMSVAPPSVFNDAKAGHNTFIAAPGLNELVFVSSSHIQIATSQSLIDDNSETVGYIKITAITSSVTPTTHQTTVLLSNDTEYQIGTVQDISTGSNVAFATVSASGNITANNLNLAGDIIHINDTDTKIGFSGTNEVDIRSGGASRIKVKSGNVGINTENPGESLTVTGNISASGHISASGIRIDNDAQIDGDLGIGGNIFGLTGFAVTIDDVAVTSDAVNFGSGSNPAVTNHKFTGSLSITGSNLTLVDGVFTGDGNSLTNLDADNLVNTHNLTWGNTLTQSTDEGSVYNVTTSIQLNVNLSGSEIATGPGGLYIPSAAIRLDHLATSTAEGDIITFSGSAKTPSYIPIGTLGQVLTSNGANNTASFKDLPPSTALGIQTGSVSDNLGNGVSVLLTSSAATNNIIAEIPISGSDNQITVSGSKGNNTIHLRLADNISGITSITASAGIRAATLYTSGDISASGNLTVGGNLNIKGDTTLLHTTNLLVEDAFLILSSGSANNDGGFIVQDGATTGKGFGYDTTIGRWGLQVGLSHDATNIIPTEWIVSAKITGSNPLVNTAPTYGQSGEKASSGQLWINTGSGDIWIYVD